MVRMVDVVLLFGSLVGIKQQSSRWVLQNISFCVKTLLSGRTSMDPNLTRFVQLISDRINPALISGFGVLLSWWRVSGRSGVCFGQSWGGFNSIAVFYIL